MKKIAILGLILASLGSSAFADEWQQVLSCDNGSVVVDKIYYQADPYAGSGYSEQAQVVIRDPNIVDYFVRNGFGRNEDGHFISSKNEWIAQVNLYNVVPGRPNLTFFYGHYSSKGNVSTSSKNRVVYDENGLNVIVTNAALGGAFGPMPFKSVNWQFRNCIRN